MEDEKKIKVERIEPREIPEPQYVPPEVEIETIPAEPPEQKEDTRKYDKSKYKTFKEHLADIRRKVKKNKKSRRKS
jgi:hypothetical protein